jgi:HEAT repeat protein
LETLHALIEDPAWEVRAHAARGLGLLGSPRSVPPLRALLDDRQWWVRFHAATALAEMGADGRAALVEARDGASVPVADMARYVLARSRSVAPALP